MISEATIRPSLTRYSCVASQIETPYARPMKGVPGTLQEGGAAFASTHWSVVLLTAQSQAPEAAQAAMTGFCQTYWPPLYTFLAPSRPVSKRRARSDSSVLRSSARTKYPHPRQPGKRQTADVSARFAPALPGQPARLRPGCQTRRRPADRLHGRSPHRGGSVHAPHGADRCDERV